MDVASLEPLVHQIDVRAVLLGLPDGVPGLVEDAVLIGVVLLGDQVTGQAVDLVGNPGLVAPAAVVQVAVLLGMELLVGRQVGLKVFQAGDLRGGVGQANFVRGVHVDDVAHGNAQLLVGGDRVVDAVDLGTGDERGVQGLQNALAVLLEQVAVGAVVIVQGQEQVAGHFVDVALPVRSEEDIDLLASLQSGDRTSVPVTGGDDDEVDVRTDQGLDVGVDGFLNGLTHGVVLHAVHVVGQGVDIAGSRRGLPSGALVRRGGLAAVGRSRRFRRSLGR